QSRAFAAPTRATRSLRTAANGAAAPSCWRAAHAMFRASRRSPGRCPPGSPRSRLFCIGIPIHSSQGAGAASAARPPAGRWRTRGVRVGIAASSVSLSNQAARSDLKMNRLPDLIDDRAASHDVVGDARPPQRFERTRIPASPPLSLDLNRGEIRSVIWATGFRPDYSWLEAPVFDRKGRIRHEGGVVDSPGLYL